MPAAKKKILDIDALLAEHRDKVDSERQYVKVKLFGKEWRISNQINSFLALRAGEGDPQAFTEYLLNCPHEDEREDFRRELFRAEVMDNEGLLMVINHLMEAVAEHPTKSSSASSRSGQTPAAKRKSAAT